MWRGSLQHVLPSVIVELCNNATSKLTNLTLLIKLISLFIPFIVYKFSLFYLLINLHDIGYFEHEIDFGDHLTANLQCCREITLILHRDICHDIGI